MVVNSAEESLRAVLTRGTQTSFEQGTAELLRVRLRSLTIYLIVILSGFLAIRLFEKGSPSVFFGIIALPLVGGLLLFTFSRDLQLKSLRRAELALILLFEVLVLVAQHSILSGRIGRVDETVLLMDLQMTVVPHVLFVFLYALLIPNSLKRAAAVLIPLGVAVLALRPILYVQHPELREIWRFEQISRSSVAMIMAVGGALYGIHIINRLRREADKARRLGQYHLTEKLGSGGMGEVWKAEHQLLARPAAVKLIRAEMLAEGNPDTARTMLARFEREAQATARLTSPHTVVVYDFGISAEGTFYYVMELLSGLDLGGLVNRFGPVPPGRVIYLLAQACDSLMEAHSLGLVHRDIKPANLFACNLGLAADFVKILDFGLVKLGLPESQDATHLTRIGAATGTPAFMSPEQALGETLDSRTDLYALGGVGYWLLTGELVFDAENALGLAIRHVRDEPVSVGARGVAVPQDLEEVIMTCLSKKPQDRFPDAQALRQALLSCRCACEWDRERAARWWRENSEVAASAVASEAGSRPEPSSQRLTPRELDETLGQQG